MTTTPSIGILALQGDVAEHARALQLCGCAPVLIKKSEQLIGLDGLIFPGGESTTIWKLLNLYTMIEPIKKVLDAGLPVWGTCAGMILLGKTILDGTKDQGSFKTIDITVRRNAFGRQLDSFEEKIKLMGIAEENPFPCIFIRAPLIESVGTHVTVLGTTQSGAIVAAQDKNCLVTSFHPELTTDTRFHHHFIELVKKNRYTA